MPTTSQHHRFHQSAKRTAAVALSVLALSVVLLAPTAPAQDDSGKDLMISPTDLQGNERIWGLILYATDAEEIAAPQPSSQDEEKKFRTDAINGVLGKVKKALPQFKSFKVLGAHDQMVLREYATWITPSSDFFLAIDSKGRAKEGDGVNIYLQLWNRKAAPGEKDKVLLKSDAVLKRSSPLIIEGPKWRQGRVVFVLTLEYSELFDSKPVAEKEPVAK
ncbi:MAG: hypothetical protein O3C21_18130 [Verrucomicrobia bacterium]|nr:hypothetical protein [Verrucomicrobiota bacterium]